jgi:hypothetical protein
LQGSIQQITLFCQLGYFGLALLQLNQQHVRVLRS